MSTASEKQRSAAHRQDTKTARMKQSRQQSEPEPTVSAPPRAKVQQRSVATWTHQDRQEAPKFFVSDLPWKAQRRVHREMPLDRVPWPFRGRTITEADMLSQGARLPDPPGVRECALCGVNVYSKSHYKGSLHVAKAKAARDGGRPTSSAPLRRLFPTRTSLPCAARGFSKTLDFAALVGPVFQAATAPTASTDGGTSEDVLIDFESFMRLQCVPFVFFFFPFPFFLLF
ncbi:hypothetical protein MTO96_043832 [Rhipicephalus appendiculatus]